MNPGAPLTGSVSDAAQASSLWAKLRRGLSRTHETLRGRIDAAVGGGLDKEAMESLEEALIAADIGVETSMALLDEVRRDFRRGDSRDGRGDGVRLRERLADEISVVLVDAPQPAAMGSKGLTLVAGVNGVGKTTSIAKMAWRFRQEGRSVLLAAADTFRAAAIEQLEVWGQRLDVPIVRQKAGADPAAVVYDALQAARARDIDQVIVDTAGRLHTRTNLMAELAKIGRVAGREAASRQQRTLLVLDATTGQNAISQAREFSSALELDGIFLTKLDGTARGGIVVALARELRLPVVYLGVGERMEDIVPFDARDFVRALLE